MALAPDEVRQIAELARLEICEEDIEDYARNLSELLDFVEQMNAVETGDVLPMAHPQDESARLREDTVTEIDRREHFQRIAPQVEAGLYLVPKVIE